MATQPGTPGAAMPASEDTLVRRVADLERAVRELGPSIARSFNGTIAALPVVVADSSRIDNFATTTTSEVVALFTVPVPPGKTTVSVTLLSDMYAYTPSPDSGAPIRLSLSLIYKGQGGGPDVDGINTRQTTGAGVRVSAQAALKATGLTDGFITILVMRYANDNVSFPAQPTNTCTTGYTAIFYN